ncbi:MAG TPA: thioredoxin fold domain-containing protein [Flavobacterium sp.]|nr:thioredoxin fold domain-containing protein [Flavobacterium sp.]
MRKIQLLLFIFFCLAIQAQEKIQFHDGNLPEVLQLSKSEKKPILFMFYATWCSHCNKMKAEVLNQPEIVSFCNANFVCAWQDAEKGSGPAIAKQYGVKAFPTFAVMDSNGELLYSFSGEFKTDTFIQECKNALDPKMQFPYLKSQFLAEPDNADKCYAYVAALRKSNLDANEPAKIYLSKLKETELISSINWKILANGIREIDSREFQYVLKNQEAFAAVSSAKRVERKIVNIVMEALMPYAQLSDTVNYFKERTAAAAIGMPKTDSLVFKYDRMLFENTKNWKAYHQTVSKSIQQLSWKYPSEINEIANVYLKNIEDPKALKEAVVWETHSAEIKESKDSYLLLAKLSIKADDKNGAKRWAEKARDFSLQYGFNTTDADEIINQIK